jgi:hypothetical protein
MPRVGFETTFPVFRRAKTCHTLDRSSISHFIFPGPIHFTSIFVCHLCLGLPAYQFFLYFKLKFNMQLLSSCVLCAFPSHSSDLTTLIVLYHEYNLWNSVLWDFINSHFILFHYDLIILPSTLFSNSFIISLHSHRPSLSPVYKRIKWQRTKYRHGS